MEDIFIRTKMLIGEESQLKLQNSKVMVFGIGGVGSFVVESLARGGVGHIVMIDNDVISYSNINRQIHSDFTTVGMLKTQAMAERIEKINPELKITAYELFVLDNLDDIDFSNVDYIVDAVDTVTAKINIIKKAKELNIPVISSMGTGNKLNPLMLEITDISKTSVCPLAKVMRRELKNRGIKNVKVCYSKEEVIPPLQLVEGEKRITPGSVSFVTGAAGLIIGGEVIKDLISF